MIEWPLKNRCCIHRRLSRDATDRTELAVTANNGRWLHSPLSSEAAARLLPSDARCRVQLRSAPLGRFRLHSAATATESARLYSTTVHGRCGCSRNPSYSLWSPRRGEYKRQALDISRNPSARFFMVAMKNFRPRDSTKGRRSNRCFKSDFTAFSKGFELWISSAFFFLFSERRIKRTHLTLALSSKADKASSIRSKSFNGFLFHAIIENLVLSMLIEKRTRNADEKYVRFVTFEYKEM